VVEFGAEDRNVLSLRDFWFGEQWVWPEPCFTERPNRILSLCCKYVVQFGQNSIEEASTNICHARKEGGLCGSNNSVGC